MSGSTYNFGTLRVKPGRKGEAGEKGPKGTDATGSVTTRGLADFQSNDVGVVQGVIHPDGLSTVYLKEAVLVLDDGTIFTFRYADEL